MLHILQYTGKRDRHRFIVGVHLCNGQNFQRVYLISDELLIEVARRLRSCVRHCDQVTDNLLDSMGARAHRTLEAVCRLGGDEFAIVIRDASDHNRVVRVADAVIELLSRPYEVEHHTLYIGASVGSAIGPRDGSTVETLMRNADLALYRSKEVGGGSHHGYEPSLHQEAEERRKLEFSLRRALEKSEMMLNYQPVVDAVTEEPVSFEALLRWNSAEHGPVSPVKFIPVAEDTRLIVPIGEWVLRTACFEAMNWPSPIKVAVNVSGEQLLDPGFAEIVVSALAASGLPPHRLEIEVTESIFVRDGTAAQQTLERIMSLGCGVALDDFGTGYSSLAYLKKLPVDELKIDQSFVKCMETDADDAKIVRSTIELAHNLGLSVVAEGVENEAVWHMLRELKCDQAQGYHMGRPMPAETFSRWVVSWLERHCPIDNVPSAQLG